MNINNIKYENIDNILYRNVCVICENTEFEIIEIFNNFPVKAICTNNMRDLFYNKTIIYCKYCGCCQLKYLVNSNELYNTEYINSTFSPAWTDHHIYFRDFILSSNPNSSNFLEIGANTGTLYTLLVDKVPIKSYTTLDMYHNSNLPKDIKFIQGNCESYDFTKEYNTHIILSHVFEHLYNPNNFLKQICKSSITHIYISIPNFDRLIQEESITILHSQHTFYCGQAHIEYLFAKYGFQITNRIEYNGSFASFMCLFQKCTNISIQMPFINKINWINIYKNNVELLRNIEISPNTYIMPSGLYGLYIYYFIKNKDNILGFLDNDKRRHGKRLYGTNKNVYMPCEINKHDTYIFLCINPYQNEILESLLKNGWSIDQIMIQK